MNQFRALVLAIASIAVATPLESMAMPLTSPAAIQRAQSGQTMLEPVQYRRYTAPGAVRGPVRAPVRRHRRGGSGAAAAIIGLGVLGAIAAGSAASAGPARCWYERRRVVDDWGRVIAVQRVRFCR